MNKISESQSALQSSEENCSRLEEKLLPLVTEANSTCVDSDLGGWALEKSCGRSQHFKFSYEN